MRNGVKGFAEDKEDDDGELAIEIIGYLQKGCFPYCARVRNQTDKAH